MTGGKCHRLVEEEQLSILARRHHLPLSPPELEQTANPGFVLPAARSKPPMMIMKNTSVTHYRPAEVRIDEFAQR